MPPDTTTSDIARPSGGTTGPRESGPRAHGNNRQFLSVAPNTILSHELEGITVNTASRTNTATFSRLHGGPSAAGLDSCHVKRNGRRRQSQQPHPSHMTWGFTRTHRLKSRSDCLT